MFYLSSSMGQTPLWKSVQSWGTNPCEPCRVIFGTYCSVVLFSCCALVCRYLTVNIAASLPSWRLANQHFTRVTQEWQSRDKSFCLDFKSSSLIPGLLWLPAVQDSAFLSFNTICHEDCTSDSLFLLCNKPWYPEEMLGPRSCHWWPFLRRPTLPFLPHTPLLAWKWKA